MLGFTIHDSRVPDRRRDLQRLVAPVLRLRREILAGIDELIALKFVLLVIELPVASICCQQIFLCPTLDNLPIFQH